MKLGKKEKTLKARGSLAARILLIALVFLVIPLLGLFGLLYVEDMRIKSGNNYFTLNILMDQKRDLINEIIDHELNFLAGITYLLPKTLDPSSSLKELARREEVSMLFHLAKDGEGRFYSDMGSNQSVLQKDYSDLVFQAQKGTFFIVDPITNVFYLTRIEKSEQGAWVIAFTLPYLLKNFPIEHAVIRPASTSLVTTDGTILFSTDSKLQKATLSFVTKDKKKYISFVRTIPRTNFSLMIAAPKAVNFVDIPYFILKVVIALSSVAVIGGGGVLFLTKKLARPFRHLVEVMEGIGQGELTRRFHKEKWGFEINTIGAIFNATVDSLEENMEAVQKERLEKKAYEEELRIGKEVQKAILPKEVPHFPGLDIAARFIAAKEVGGDFYDFLIKDQLMISIADTSGKGISACLYSLTIRSMLRSYGEIHKSLDVILRETNNLFCHDTGDTGVFVTAFVAFFDPKTKVLHYSNCGHFPVLRLKRDGTVERLTTEGIALGVIPFDTVITKKVTLEEGDQLLFFTDGIVEAHNREIKLFGEERLIRSFQDKQGWESQKIVDQMIEEVSFFADGVSQFDDLSLVVVKVL